MQSAARHCLAAMAFLHGRRNGHSNIPAVFNAWVSTIAFFPTTRLAIIRNKEAILEMVSRQRPVWAEGCRPVQPHFVSTRRITDLSESVD